jgi:Ca2+-binding RTX toxin-like protein
VLHIKGPEVDSNLSSPTFIGDINGDGAADLTVSAYNGFKLDIFIVFSGAMLEDGTDTANESEATAINLFAGSVFAPVTQPISEINGEAVLNGSTVVTGNGSTILVIDALNGDIEFTSGASFEALGIGETDTEDFTFSTDGLHDANFTIENLGLDSDDVITGTDANDVLSGGLGDDQITDDRGADRLNGDSGDDDLTSGRNNDILDGGTGVDVMRGGTGNDRYFVDDAADQVIELAGEGTDLVEASGAFTFVLSSNVENLNLIDDTDGTGNGADNRINGGTGANTILGGGVRDIIGGEDGDDILLGQVGDDVLRGGAGLDNLQGAEGNDVLFGGAGEDIYVIEDAFNMVTENVGEGINIVRAGTNIGAHADNVENIIAIGDTGLLLTGNDLDNTIFGCGEGDFIIGAGGDDVLRGGAGDDVYVFELGDQIIERTDEGTDTTLFDSDTANAGDTVFNSSNVEELLIGGSVDVNAIGTQGDERIAGSTSDNIIRGGRGEDLLQGSDGNDLLIRNTGQDTLDGGAGDDRIKAGRDGDTFIYRPGDGRDRVFDFGGDGKVDLTAFDFDVLSEIVPFIRETGAREVFFNFGGGDVLKLVGFPLIFLDDKDFIL